MPNREDSNPFNYSSQTVDAPLSRQQSPEAQDATAQEHQLLVERFRAHFADKYTAKSPSNPKGPLPAQMVQTELAHNAEGGHNTLKKAFYRPIWLAWNVVSFDHLGGTWAGTEAHAGGNLQRELERGHQLITLSEPQSKMLDALADFAQIPEYKRHPRAASIRPLRLRVGNRHLFSGRSFEDRKIMSELADLRQNARRFQVPILGKSLSQAVTSFGGFFATCAAMYLLNDLNYWLSLALVPLAAGFLVRIFIIQHDCGHGSFFRGRSANNTLGFACSLLTLTPYASWRRQHAGHHGIWNDLDRRQSGRWSYRVTRHPFVANLILPPLVFLGLYRVPFDTPRAWRRERRAVYFTNAALIAMFGGLGLLLGFDEVAAVQLPVLVLASIVGVWLFSIQHRGNGTRWTRREDWSSVSAALGSSNYLRLPSLLQWFTGNIGYHHVHHLNPRIPNYRLQECHEAIPAFRDAPTLSLRDGLRALGFVLWDEERGRMVTINEADATVPGS
jgi:omega-6 fatty acid desaturase (delta-12 desaturase)